LRAPLGQQLLSLWSRLRFRAPGLAQGIPIHAPSSAIIHCGTNGFFHDTSSSLAIDTLYQSKRPGEDMISRIVTGCHEIAAIFDARWCGMG
jgi:hypothetical protein